MKKSWDVIEQFRCCSLPFTPAMHSSLAIVRLRRIGTLPAAPRRATCAGLQLRRSARDAIFWLCRYERFPLGLRCPSRCPKRPPLALAAPNQTAPAYPAQPSAVRHAVHHPALSYAEYNPSSSNADYAQPRPAANPYIGQVTAITPIATQQGNETGLGMIGGAVVGGLLGNQVGKGNGRTLATVAGAAGGGYAGHEAENYHHRDTSYNVSVHVENGSLATG